jgi:hypothetical protein
MAMPTAEIAEPGTSEARSAIGSVLTQLVAIVRQMLQMALNVMQRFVTWAGEHPLAMVLTTANLAIWVS